MADSPEIHDPESPTVRPRLVWSGIGSAIVGLVLVGLGMINATSWLVWAAAGVMVAGLLVAWRGGVVYDTRGQEPPHHEVKEAIEGGQHEGVSPAARAVGHDAEARARSLSEHEEELLARSTMTPAPPVRPLAVFTLLLVGAWLLVGQWLLHYPFTVLGQDSALRDVGFAVVLALGALRLRLPTRSLVSSGVCLLSGGLLVLSACAPAARLLGRADQRARDRPGRRRPQCPDPQRSTSADCPITRLVLAQLMPPDPTSTVVLVPV